MTTPWSNQRVDLIILQEDVSGFSGLFGYTPSIGAGNLIFSIAATAGTDPYGNAYPAGVSTTGGNSTIAGQDYLINASGIFFYNGTPAAGNLVASISSTAGTDAFGNAYPAGESLGVSGQSQIQFQPVAGNAVTMASGLTGILGAAAQAFTSDSHQVLPGSLGSIVLGTGNAAKMATFVTSPVGVGSGAAIVLQAQNDGGTDTSILTFGTVTTPDSSTYVFTPIMTLTPYALVLYAGTSGTTVVTKATGSGTIPIPAGVSTAYAEAWGGGGGGANAGGGVGGSGAEYAAEPSLAVTGGGTVAYSVGAGGAGGAGAFNAGNPGHNGGDTTLTGTSVTVTAHHGVAGGGVGAGPAGGTGSTNSIHHDGGAGGASRGSAGVGSNPNGGSGGGSSGGTSSAGNAGQQATSNTGGDGGAAVVGGGAGGGGGHGGSTSHTGGAAGGAPGGGGGGGGFNPTNGFDEAGGTGASGQVRLTYSTGAPVVLMSAATAAFTDQFGNAIPAGLNWTTATQLFTVPRAQLATFPGTTVTASALTTIASATYPGGDAVAGACYELEINGNGTQGSTQQRLEFAVVFGGVTMANATLGSTYMAASQTFRWKARCRIFCHTTGTTATWSSELELFVSVFGSDWSSGPGGSSTSETGAGITCESSGTSTVNSTVNQTLALQCGWISGITGAPTLTSRVAMFKRVA